LANENEITTKTLLLLLIRTAKGFIALAEKVLKGEKI